MDEIISFGVWLKHRRRELDLTQAELGRRVACSEAAIRKIEAGERKPSQQLAELLAKELHLSVEERPAFLQFARGILQEETPSFSVPSPSHLPGRFFSPARSNNLPSFLTSLVDRTKDIEAVHSLVVSPEVRWVSLIGAPGIGKTRLSIHCSLQSLNDFINGVWFVDLSSVLDPRFVVAAISKTLRYLDLPSFSTLEQLKFALQKMEILLVLDNFEQVENAATDVADLLKACPGVKVLVTSRVPLNVYGEFKYYLPPLSIPPAESSHNPDSLIHYEAVQLFAISSKAIPNKF